MCARARTRSVQAASKFCAAPITIVHEARPYATPAGQYPVFDVTPTKCANFDFDQFCDFLRHSSNVSDVLI
jgi:hypothetical protein